MKITQIKSFAMGLAVLAGVASAGLNSDGLRGVSKTHSAQSMGNSKMGIGFTADGHQDQSVFDERTYTKAGDDAAHLTRIRYRFDGDTLDQHFGRIDKYTGVNLFPFVSIGFGEYFDIGLALPIYYESMSVTDVDPQTGVSTQFAWTGMTKTSIGDVRLNSKIRFPIPEESLADVALLLGAKVGTNNKTNGYWIREIESFDSTTTPAGIRSANGTVTSSGNGQTAFKFGGALTLDFRKTLNETPVLLHANYIYRMSNNEIYPSVSQISGAAEVYPVPFFSLWAEYYTEMPDFDFADKATNTPMSVALASLSAGGSIHTELGFEVTVGFKKAMGTDGYLVNVMTPPTEEARQLTDIEGGGVGRNADYYSVRPQANLSGYIGLTWNGFLLPQDDDGDGLVNKEDGCPMDPEDEDGFEDHDGCPEPDNDKDGLEDEDDQCPLDPEDKDDFMDEDGCPDNDNDGDGTPDQLDRCPVDPEDKDGWEDNDGCPDEDNDRDGLKDELDECPDQAETRNGIKDEDGCPEGDADVDGIQDDEDQCPTQKEDIDRFQDEDGCPDPDNDEDGILDVNDKCPMDKESVNGIDDEDGCPEVDTDGDGIQDAQDRCPHDAETVNGVDDEDGCPEDDIDSDGIKDTVDQCPKVPEDRDGFEDEDGCPDVDNDKDGILDSLDKCPLQPETMNGKDDDDGCPDVKEKPITNVTLDGVNFKTGTADLTFEAKQVLDGVVKQLLAYPEVEIEIRGHTDSQGSNKSNQKLSERRAQSVVDYFASKGVAMNRMKALGLGETQPIETNKTAAGRAKNRRIEMYRTK